MDLEKIGNRPNITSGLPPAGPERETGADASFITDWVMPSIGRSPRPHPAGVDAPRRPADPGRRVAPEAERLPPHTGFWR